MDNICALATPIGRSAIAVVRISGPGSIGLIEALSEKKLVPRMATLCHFKDSNGNYIDEALVTVFISPNSYTGDDLVEIGVHGNPFIVENLMREIVSRETFRMARPGEFSFRALLNGRLSIDKVEALDMVLNAETEEVARRSVVSKIQGLNGQISLLREKLKEILVRVESALDFSENETGAVSSDNMRSDIEEVISHLQNWTHIFRQNADVLNEKVVVLVGAPNVGKSSLFNKLLGQNRSLVHEKPGTTRDFIEQTLILGGRKLVLVDTAGLRATQDPVERMGVDRSLELVERADICLWVSDGASPVDQRVLTVRNGREIKKILSKADCWGRPVPNGWVPVSSMSSAGMDKLIAELTPPFIEGNSLGIFTSRQKLLISEAESALFKALNVLNESALDGVAFLIHQASVSLSEVVDQVPTEDVLKQIFSRFCIGK